jgi:hypothetical protein
MKERNSTKYCTRQNRAIMSIIPMVPLEPSKTYLKWVYLIEQVLNCLCLHIKLGGRGVEGGRYNVSGV